MRSIKICDVFSLYADVVDASFYKKTFFQSVSQGFLRQQLLEVLGKMFL